MQKAVNMPYFYPRSPCGERLFLLRKITITVDISIHALLAESDFYNNQCQENEEISIHALLAESDPRRQAKKT